MDLFFFFQAEDGIRDADVTGVQTCALPISARDRHGDVRRRPRRTRMGRRRLDPRMVGRPGSAVAPAPDLSGARRRQGTLAIATPHGSVPHGTRATTVFAGGSITATSLPRPIVTQRNL